MRSSDCLPIAAILLALAGAPASALAATVMAQVKSFIATVDLTDPKQFDPGSKSCQTAMAALVNCGTIGGEDPKAPSKTDGGYRLWSEVKADATCAGDKVTGWNIAPVSIDAGNEFVFITTSADLSPSLRATPSQAGSSPVDKISFSYRMRGQPNVAANKLMSEVKPRSCSFIWHVVEGNLSCKAGKPVLNATLRGSGFPSHRLWIDGKLVKDQPQGPFDKLWRCDAIDPTLVQ